MSENKGRTLWQLLMDRLGFGEPAPVPAWKQICNPLDIKPGQYLEIDLLDFRGRRFKVVEVAEYVVQRNRTDFRFFEATAACGDEQLYVRLVPAPQGVKAILLQQHDAFAADTEDGKAISNIIRNDPAGQFRIDTDQVHEEYWRVDDVKSPYVAKVRVVSSEAADAEVKELEVEYLDYWRSYEDEGVQQTQYLYIEQNTDNGWLALKRGPEVGTDRITVW